MISYYFPKLILKISLLYNAAFFQDNFLEHKKILFHRNFILD